MKQLNRMISEAYNEEQEGRLWQQYLVAYANMDEKHFTNYEKFKEESQAKKKDKKEDVKEILKKAERIRRMDKNRKPII